MTRRKLAGLTFGTLLFMACCFALWKISDSRTFQFFGSIVPRVEASDKIIALTFDDGPTPVFTDEILQLLENEDVKATFFLIGGELEKHPDEGKKIAAAGHEIGNHSFSHQRMLFVMPSFVKSEIERTDELIRAAGFHGQIHFRPPFGKKLFTVPYYLSRNNRTTITWDIEPESHPEVATNPEKLAEYAISNTRNGSIILLHVMYDRERKSMYSVKPLIRA